MISPLIIEEIMHIIVIANRARQDLIVATNLWLTTNLTGTFYKIRNYIKLDDDANAKELHSMSPTINIQWYSAWDLSSGGLSIN